MTEEAETVWREKQLRDQFEAELPQRMRRASRIRLQNFIPAHWFAAAASDCARMFVAGFFYGAVSVAQAYVEALSRYLALQHTIRVGKDTEERCRRLNSDGIISINSLNAALAVFRDRNDFHHLNRDVEQDNAKLEALAEDCINQLHTIESEIFAWTIGEKGKIIVRTPDYWPSEEAGTVQVNLRQLW